LKKWVLSKHDSRILIERVQTALSITLDIPKSSQVVNYEPSDGIRFIVINGMYTFVNYNNEFVPFLGSHESTLLFPSIRVDQGAIKFLVNGADVMRPGVVSYDEWGDAGKIAVIREGEKDRSIAIGVTLVRSSDMQLIQKGACARNIHHIGDKYWSLFKQI
jgi:PUA domain protein